MRSGRRRSAGRASVTNGPLLELTVNGQEPGAVLDAPVAEGRARVVFHRPIEKLEIIANGEVVASRSGDGAATELTLPFAVDTSDSTWIAARASSPKIEDEPDIRAHTNPVYVLRAGRRVRVDAARRSVLARWEREAGTTHGSHHVADELSGATPEKVDAAWTLCANIRSAFSHGSERENSLAAIFRRFNPFGG